MSLNRKSLRELIGALEREHGDERGVWPVQRFHLHVQFDDGAEYAFRWPRGAVNPAWQVERQR